MFSQRVKYAIQILAELEKAKRDGVRLSKRHFSEQCALEPAPVSEVLRVLHVGRWVNYVGSAFFLIRYLTDATLYDLVMVIDGRISMDNGIHQGWPQQNRTQVSCAKVVVDCVTDRFVDNLKSIYLSDMFDCYAVTDRRTLLHMRKNSREEIMKTSRQAK